MDQSKEKAGAFGKRSSVLAIAWQLGEKNIILCVPQLDTRQTKEELDEAFRQYLFSFRFSYGKHPLLGERGRISTVSSLLFRSSNDKVT